MTSTTQPTPSIIIEEFNNDLFNKDHAGYIGGFDDRSLGLIGDVLRRGPVDAQTCYDIFFIVSAMVDAHVTIATRYERDRVCALVSEAMDDIRAKELEVPEAMLRIQMRTLHPRETSGSGSKIPQEERELIQSLFKRGISLSSLSRVFKRSKSTIGEITKLITPEVD